MEEKKLALEYVHKTLSGVKNLLDIFYEVGERGNNFMTVQGFYGQLLVASMYLEKDYSVFWAYPKYDLRVTKDTGENLRVEIKTGKCWNENLTSKCYANAFGLKLENFEVFCFVLISGDYALDSRRVFKILEIPKKDLSECSKPHKWACPNGTHPSFVYYGNGKCGEFELGKAEVEGTEIYDIERRIAKDESPYVFWEDTSVRAGKKCSGIIKSVSSGQGKIYQCGTCGKIYPNFKRKPCDNKNFDK